MRRATPDFGAVYECDIGDLQPGDDRDLDFVLDPEDVPFTSSGYTITVTGAIATSSEESTTSDNLRSFPIQVRN